MPVFPLLIDDVRDLVHTELDALFLDNLSGSITKRVPEWLAPMDSIDVHDDIDQDLWKEGTSCIMDIITVQALIRTYLQVPSMSLHLGMATIVRSWSTCDLVQNMRHLATQWHVSYSLLEAKDTFKRSITGMLAVSTANPEPLNAFAELYEATSPDKLFADKPWVDPNVLRYYVLVHDATVGPAEE